MNPARSILLAASQNAWLRDHAAKHRFVRRTVSRFMPGEELSDALAAAQRLQTKHIGSIFTHLGENITDKAEARGVTAHYLEVLRSVREWQLDAEISVKATQLGLDLSPELCYSNLKTIIEQEDPRCVVWVDMEASNYVDATLQLYRRALREFPNVGVCLQSYLHRTKNDLANLLPLRPSIRLVKGAYSEPAEIAFPEKSRVDENYFLLAKEMLLAKKFEPKIRAAFGTHDVALLRRISDFAATTGLPKANVEVQMLYGIKSSEQERLAREGYSTKVLVAYGSHWYAWFIRRLAERPANLWFVARNLFHFR
ncbi:MAG TPA: proline dehydrogenase family protein [Candidatus Acidoferrum sp.]|jgi:proline dehydrogenase|nr:proline dehydrogenase family protein [Candidatus Acidoferrum sp.]